MRGMWYGVRGRGQVCEGYGVGVGVGSQGVRGRGTRG